ncbi:MAG: hypothetical protein U1D31_00935 [Patescibacteria group bacterium]|nr:hypothetical protein [bacterium]MDZ4240685.1 hypothetical protein [Patescibacteria group bacterium]
MPPTNANECNSDKEDRAHLFSKEARLQAEKLNRLTDRKKVRDGMRLLVRAVATYYFCMVCPKDISFISLAKAGFRGRDKALEKFDPAQGCAFGRYLMWHIHFEVKEVLYAAGILVRVRVHEHGRHPHLIPFSP